MDSNNDSLEMLLDTICNTFGAVLFIAMLIVLLVDPNAREGGGETIESLSTEYAEVESEITEMQLEAERLERVLSQQETLTERFGNPDSQVIVNEVVKAKRTQARLIEDRAEKTKQLAKTDEENARVREQMRTRRAALKRARDDAKQATEQLKQASAKSSRSAQTPKAVRLRTTPIVTMLKGGVWYCLVKPNTAGQLKINPVDCDTQPSGKNVVLKPRPGGGRNVRNTTSDVPLPVSSAPSRNHYTVYLYSDSSDEYRVVKNAIAASGYKLQLVLMSDTSQIVFGRGVAAADAWGH